MIPHNSRQQQQYSKIVSTITTTSSLNNTVDVLSQKQSPLQNFDKEFPSLQQSYKKHYLNKSFRFYHNINNNNNVNQNDKLDNCSNILNTSSRISSGSGSTNTTTSTTNSFSEKDIELLKVFRNEIMINNNENDCWKKRDLLYYVFIQKPHEIQRIASFISSVATYYELPSRNHLLDIGCGLGRMFEMWDRSKWQHIDAFEPDKDYFQFSLNHAHNLTNAEKVQVYNIGFQELSQVYNKYDMVVSIHGPLQYLIKLEDRIQALRNIYNSLVDGGVVLLDVSNFLDALRNLRPQIEQKMLVNGVPVKRISNITVDTFNSIWSVEDIFYSNSGIKNNNNNNNSNSSDKYNDNPQMNKNDDDGYDNNNNSINNNNYKYQNNNNNNNGGNEDEDEFLNEDEYADGGFVVEQLQFSILSVNELKLLLLSTGFINIKVVSSWGDSITTDKDHFANINHGPRIIITGQKLLNKLNQ